jgi:N,N'-diacetyllegionaminate synthase
MPLAAVALGARIIESHITLDKSQSGPDHKASLEPQQFAEMVRGIRAIEKALA